MHLDVNVLPGCIIVFYILRALLATAVVQQSHRQLSINVLALQQIDSMY